MTNSTVVKLRQPEFIDDPRTDFFKNGTENLISKAVEAEPDMCPWCV